MRVYLGLLLENCIQLLLFSTVECISKMIVLQSLLVLSCAFMIICTPNIYGLEIMSGLLSIYKLNHRIWEGVKDNTVVLWALYINLYFQKNA